MCLIKVAVMYLFSVCLSVEVYLFICFYTLIVLKNVLLAPSKAEKETGIECTARGLLRCWEFSFKIIKLILLMDFNMFF